MECFNLKWRPVGQPSSVECMWTGWALTGLVSWAQTPESVRPRRPSSGRLIASYCDAGKVTHVNTTSCTGGVEWRYLYAVGRGDRSGEVEYPPGLGAGI